MPMLEIDGNLSALQVLQDVSLSVKATSLPFWGPVAPARPPCCAAQTFWKQQTAVRSVDGESFDLAHLAHKDIAGCAARPPLCSRTTICSVLSPAERDRSLPQGA